VPTYEYACTSCGEQLEAVQRFSDDPLTVCPACGGALRKVFSPVGIVFKGSGFYRTDSRKSVVPSGSGKDGASDKDGASRKDGGSDTGSSKDKGASKSNGSGDSSSSEKKGSSDSGSSSSDTKSATKTTGSKKSPAGAGSST
jgi:putative FmdB family regulatory protein